MVKCYFSVFWFYGFVWNFLFLQEFFILARIIYLCKNFSFMQEFCIFARILYFWKIYLFFDCLLVCRKLGLFLRIFEVERVCFWWENVVIKWSGKWSNLFFWNFGKKSIFTDV